MKNIYVLDTSALVKDPSVWKKFPDSEIIIPIVVLRELDKLKKQSNEVGKNARVAIRLLDELSDKFDLSLGIEIENKSLIKVDSLFRDISDPKYSDCGDPTYGDTKIWACAVDCKYKNPEADVTLVSNDFNLKIMARAKGLHAISHDEVDSSDELYTGQQVCNDLEVASELITHSEISTFEHDLDHLHLNEFLAFEDTNQDTIALGRKVCADKIKLVRAQYPWDLVPRNREQAYAIDLIMDRDVPLVSLVGKAGTGKTLVTLAACLELVLEKKKYDKLIIYRPIHAVGGQELGFLPGTLEEKLEPWFQAILDGFEFLFKSKEDKKGKAAPKKDEKWRYDLAMYKEQGKIEMDAITYVRGRSIPNAIILVDEAQNLSRDDVKTLLTRAGEGSKIILTGDIDQIDNKSLDAIDNGLAYVVDKFKNSEMSGHVTFVHGERSKLATYASEIL